MSNLITKRPTARMADVIGSDLMTKQDKWTKEHHSSEYYSIADEQVFLRLPGEPQQMTVSQFERKLKTELHPNFFVLYNPYPSKNHMIEGHHMGFYVPEKNMFAPLCRVGTSGSNIIKDYTQGGVREYTGSHTGRIKEKQVISRGWVAAFEACKA